MIEPEHPPRAPRRRAAAPHSGVTLEGKLLAGFGAMVLVLVVAGCSFAGLASITQSRRRVRHTLDVIVAAQDVQMALLEAMMGQRGYLLTSEPAYLLSYREALEQTGTTLRHLRALTADHLEHQRRLVSLEGSVEEDLAGVIKAIRLQGAGESPAAMALIRASLGERTLDHGRQVLDEMHHLERDLLPARQTEYERSSRLTAEVIGGGSLFVFVLGALANLGIRSGVQERRQNQLLIEEQTARLEAQTRRVQENERALAQKLEEQRGLAEHLRLANQQLDEHVRRLASANALAEQALAERGRAGQALEKINKDLDLFAYVASHDLKAPLRGIASVSEWLEEDLAPAMTDLSREHLRLLRRRVHRMEALIDGILAYSRVSRTQSKLDRIEIASFLREVIDLLLPQTGAVTLHVPEPGPLFEVEKVPFQQVWMNLISNALKHGAREGAEVWLAAKDAGDAWECSVRDNGPGIEPQYHERIFRIFHTLASRDEVEGTGIGLAIVKKLVDDRGGLVWVESEPGQGATFHFTWPKE